MGFARFMSSLAGRMLRIAAGLGLVIFGLTGMNGAGGWAVTAVGVLPIAAGAFNVCALAPFFGAPFKGEAMLETRRQQ